MEITFRSINNSFFSFRGSHAAGLLSFPHSAPEGLDPPWLKCFPQKPRIGSAVVQPGTEEAGRADPPSEPVQP